MNETRELVNLTILYERLKTLRSTRKHSRHGSWDLKKDDEDIYGFVVYNEGQSIIPLYKKSVYFMMTESGKTFANLSLK